jgi:hypothetical protein
MSEPTTETVLRHDDMEAALPHQVEPPKEWGLSLPDPVPFEVTLPRYCPMDADALVALHWWASLSAHLHVILAVLAVYTDDTSGKVRYSVDKAMRLALAVVRDTFGQPVSAAVSVAGFNATGGEKGWTEHQEMGAWTMSVQVAFGLLCVSAVRFGREDARVKDLQEIYDRILHAMELRTDSPVVSKMLIQLCTSTPNGTLAEKLAQWNAALPTAAEGMPDGAVDGLGEAIRVEEPKEAPHE